MPDVGALQAKHPEWNLIDAIDAPGGGVWALGADGGVFALNAQGDPAAGAAPYLGSYTGLAPEQRMGTRNFVRIQADPASGGYTLVSNRGENYLFQGTAPPAPPPAPPPPAAPPPNTEAELNQLMATLRPLGLDSVVNDAWNYYKGPAGGSIAAVLDWLPTTTAYKDRFPGMEALRQKGQAWTPAQYINYEQSIQEAAQRFGVPDDFIQRDDIGRMIAGDVSVNEAVDRMQLASDAVHSSPETLAWARDNLGVDASGLMAFFLDTDGKGPDFMTRQHQFAQAQIGGAATQAGFGGISAAEAARLESQGISAAQARSAFGTVAGLHPLFEETVGESMTGQDLGRETQLGLVTGDAMAQEAVQKRQRERQAAFGGGGGASSGGRGGTGLGSSQG